MSIATRLGTITPIWSWLPAFRAVAETEHLPSAALMLGVGSSTLSRSISLLEQRVGKPLFERSGRSLKLNEEGRVFLTAVRDSMRRLDDGLQELAGSELRGPLRVSSSGAATTEVVAPALGRLRGLHPRLLPILMNQAEPAVPHELLRGGLDIAFHETPLQRDGLVSTRVATLPRSVYCGRQHPLFAATEVTAGCLADTEFVAPPADAGIVLDGWPPEQPRRIGMVTDQLRVGLEICMRMPLLAVLPDVLAQAHRESLWRLPVENVSPSHLFATHRRVLGTKKPAAVELVELVQSAAGTSLGRSGC